MYREEIGHFAFEVFLGEDEYWDFRLYREHEEGWLPIFEETYQFPRFEEGVKFARKKIGKLFLSDCEHEDWQIMKRKMKM